MRGIQIARNATAEFAFWSRPRAITSRAESTKIRTQIAMAAPIKSSLATIADVVVDVMLELLDVNVAVSDIQ